MFDFTQLFTTYYYFQKSPGGDFLTGYALLIFFIVLIMVPTLVRKFGPSNKYFKKSIKRRLGKFIFIGVLGLIAVLARFAEVPVFSMRVWLYILFLLGIGCAIWTGVTIKKDYQKRQDAAQREKKKKGQA